jgi:hypothetical protein
MAWRSEFMKNKLKQVTIATLSACMIASAVPIPGNVAKAAVTQEMIDFTDENSQGGWVKDGANGTITFQNGEGDDGFMVLESAGESFFKYTVKTSAFVVGFEKILLESPFSNMEIPKPVRMEFLKWILP